MWRMRKAVAPTRLSRAGMLAGAFGAASLVTFAFKGLVENASLTVSIVSFLVLWGACYYAFLWALYDRKFELDKRIPISSKEIR